MSRIPPRLVHAYISGLPIRANDCLLLRPNTLPLHPTTIRTSASRHHHRTLTSTPPLRDENKDDKPLIRRTVAQRWAPVSEPVLPLRNVIQGSRSPTLHKHDKIGITRAKEVGKETSTVAEAEEEAIKAEREAAQTAKAKAKAHLELLQEIGSKEPLGHWTPTFLDPEAAKAKEEADKAAVIAASEAGVKAAIAELETAKAEKEAAKAAARAAAKAAVKAEQEAAAAREKSLKADASQESLKHWECTIGIEIHAQLNTAKKLFSGSRNVTGEGRGPNTELSFFDLALPGSQPQFQKETLIPALRAALALNCDINKESGWDRKHYFHWDQPNGYQITQFFKPFAQNGSIMLYPHDGIAPQDIDSASGAGFKKTKSQGVKINIKQIQMEQDTAGTITKGQKHYINFNRVGKPLIEIITGPDIHYPSTAAALVRKIQGVLGSVNACTLGMEQGGLRADVNVSVRRRGERGVMEYNGVSGLGTRTEIKNLSSFKSIRDAIIVERNRQVEVLESGGVVEGETRGYNIGDSHTTRLRGKEGEVDYRYMPDPDLPPLIIGEDLISHLRDTMCVLPDEQLEELTKKFNLSIKDALSLVSLDDGYRAEYFYSVLDSLAQKFAEPNPQGPPEGSSVIEEWKRMGYTKWYQARLARSEPRAAVSPSPSGNSTKVSKTEFERDEAWDKKFGPVVANWVLHELGGLTNRLGEDGEAMDGVLFDVEYRGRCMVRPKELAELLRLLEVGRITRKTAKYVLGELYRLGVEIFEAKKEEGVNGDWTKGLPAAVEVIDTEGLWFKAMTGDECERLARETEEERLWKDILGENRKRAEGKIMYWIGMMMREAGDRCDAKEARRVIDRLVEEKRWETGRFMVEKERKEVEGLRKRLVEMGRVVNRRVAELEKEEKDE